MLPSLLDAIGFRRGLLLGHSDEVGVAADSGGRRVHGVTDEARVAPPRVGIDNKPGDFEYTKIEH